MKNSLLKIGEMAELNHVSTQTLRLYAKNRLLEPEYLDPETGYRLKRNGMAPCGDYLCEVLTQFPVHQAKQLIYKIQVPVQRTNDKARETHR